MEKIFEGAIAQRTIAIDGTFDDSSFVAEFSLDTDEGHRRGYLYAYADIDGLQAEVSRIALISGRTLAFQPPQQFGPVSLRVQILDTEPIPQSLTLWRVDGATVGDGGGNSGGGGDGETRNLMPLLALPNSFGNVVGDGLAVFTAGHTEFNFGADEYSQTYTVDASAFWGIGARSVDPITHGRVRFGLGSGRAVVGLAEQFTEVNFRLVPWAWYIHSFEEIRAFDYVNGNVSNRGAFPWSPDRELALRVEGGTVFYEVQNGDGWDVVYTSPNPVSNPLYLCAVLGPQSFVFNCSTEEN